MKILVRIEGRYEDRGVAAILAHPTDYEWTEDSLRTEFEEVVQFIIPIYKVADNPTHQQISDGLRTQVAMRLQAIRERWGSNKGHGMAFFEWLTKERGFVSVAWTEIHDGTE